MSWNENQPTQEINPKRMRNKPTVCKTFSDVRIYIIETTLDYITMNTETRYSTLSQDTDKLRILSLSPSSLSISPFYTNNTREGNRIK